MVAGPKATVWSGMGLISGMELGGLMIAAGIADIGLAFHGKESIIKEQIIPSSPKTKTEAIIKYHPIIPMR